MIWLEEEHVRTVSVRDRFDKWVGHSGLPPTGNLLVVTLPAVTGFRTEEFRPLDTWVRAGNTLLVLAALSDDPDWAFATGRPVAGDLSLLTGLEFEVAQGAQRADSGGARSGEARSGEARSGEARSGQLVPGLVGSQPPGSGRLAPQPKDARSQRGSAPDDVGVRIAATARAFAQPQPGTLVPNGAHPYFQGVRTAIGMSDYPSQAWSVKIPYDGFVLSLAHQREIGESVLWTRALGNGRVIVSGLGSLFTNRALGLADNARLLANIVGTTVGPRGGVVFDDLHQGLGAVYDPARFYSDRRLYQTVGILAALWLCWVLGATRLQLPGPRAPAPREAELVQATGHFLARVLTPAAAASGLFEHFFRRVRERVPSTRERVGPPWELLEGHPGVTPLEVRQLRGWYADARAARRVPLGRLHNLLRKIDRHITA